MTDVRAMRGSGDPRIGRCLALIAVIGACTRARPEPETPRNEPAPVPVHSAPTNAELPKPLPFFATLSEGERRIVADEVLRRAKQVSQSASVRINPVAFDVCVDTEQVAPMQAQLAPLFSQQSDISVHGDCRSVAQLSASGLSASAFGKAFLKSSGEPDIDRIFAAVLAVFPEACGAEIDESTLVHSQFARSFAGHERRLPSSEMFQAIFVMERTRVKVEDAASRSKAAPGGQLYLSVESDIRWKSASSSRWKSVKTLQELNPRLLKADASTQLLLCAKAIVQAVMR